LTGRDLSGRVDFLDEEIAALCDAIAAHLAAEHPQPGPKGPIPFGCGSAEGAGQFAGVTVSPGLRRVASIGGTGENRARGETKGSGSL
jgi:hypothetical protein